MKAVTHWNQIPIRSHPKSHIFNPWNLSLNGCSCQVFQLWFPRSSSLGCDSWLQVLLQDRFLGEQLDRSDAVFLMRWTGHCEAWKMIWPRRSNFPITGVNFFPRLRHLRHHLAHWRGPSTIFFPMSVLHAKYTRDGLLGAVLMKVLAGRYYIQCIHLQDMFSSLRQVFNPLFRANFKMVDMPTGTSCKWILIICGILFLRMVLIPVLAPVVHGSRFAPSSMNFLAMTHGHAAGQKGADPKKTLRSVAVSTMDDPLVSGGTWRCSNCQK